MIKKMEKGINSDFLIKDSLPLWMRGKEKIVKSSSVILNRNIKGFKFPHKASLEEKRKVCSRILGRIHHSAISSELFYDSLQEMTPKVKGLLYERHDCYVTMSNECLEHNEAKVVLINKDETIVIVINDDDHLQVKASTPSFDLKSCYKIADSIIKQLDMDYAIKEPFGYLTASPAIMSTGLQIETVLHLPALMIMEDSESWTNDLREMGVTAEGVFGHGTSPHGNIFTFCNQNTRRKNIEESLSSFEKCIKNTVKKETKCRKGIEKLDLKNMTNRAYGMLRYCEKIDFQEAITGLSLVRLGIDEGTIKRIDLPTLNKLTHYIFPTELQCVVGCPPDELDIVRAKVIKQALEKSQIPTTKVVGL